MAKRPFDRPHRLFWRLALLLLVIIPSIPALVILGIAAVAAIKGCQADQKSLCLVGSLPASEVISLVLQSSASVIVNRMRDAESWFVWWFHVTVAGWLVACYAILMLGWARVVSRVLLGFALALVFAFLPYLGLMLAVSILSPGSCWPNGAYLGACKLFGGTVGDPAHDSAYMGRLALNGVRLAFAIFGGYLLIVIVRGVLTARRRLARA